MTCNDSLLLICSLMLLLIADTCDTAWQQTRDGLLISSLIISLLGFVTVIILLIVAIVDAHLRKSKYCIIYGSTFYFEDS